MKILHCEDLAATESVVTNDVVLVLGECQISMATYFSEVSTLVYSCIAMYWELTMLCQFKVIADGQTHRHTERQPQYNSFATASRLN